MSQLDLPSDYHRIRVVTSFEELASARFVDGVNAVCWPRVLPGDFDEVVREIGCGDGIATLNEDYLRGLSLTAAGRTAIDRMIEDQRRLTTLDLDPALNCIHGYPPDENPGPVPTDVFSFHADSATVETYTWLCTYHGPPSEGLRNDEAIRRVDLPATRAELLRLFGGPDDATFLDWLNENCYDLHYAPIPGAQPFSFGIGNLWRIGVEYQDSPVPPCIHRAPDTKPGESPRLLLIS